MRAEPVPATLQTATDAGDRARAENEPRRRTSARVWSFARRTGSAMRCWRFRRWRRCAPAIPESHLTIAAPASVAPLFREGTPVAPDAVLDTGRRRAQRVDAASRAGSSTRASCFRIPFGSRGMRDSAGIPERWGYRSPGRGWLLTRAVESPAGVTPSSVRLLSRAGARPRCRRVTIDAPAISATASSAERAPMRCCASTDGRPTRRYFAVMPGAAYGQAKQWPPDRMAGRSPRGWCASAASMYRARARPRSARGACDRILASRARATRGAARARSGGADESGRAGRLAVARGTVRVK